MYKKFLPLFACLLFSSFVFSQSPVNVKNRLLGVEGVNFLRHGIYSFQIRINQGTVEYAYHDDRPMTEIKGTEKNQQLIQLLGDRTKEYSDLNCACLSIWKTGNLYTIFELDDNTDKEDYRIGYHIIRQ